MTTNDPIPAVGTVVLDQSTGLSALVIVGDDGRVAGARVRSYKPGSVEGGVYLDASIEAADPDHLHRLAEMLGHAAAMLRDALGAEAVADTNTGR